MKKVVKLGALLVVLLGIIIVLFSVSFANLTENRKIEIYSSSEDWENEEAGSWKITEEANWNKNGNFHVNVKLESKPVSENTPVNIIFVVGISERIENNLELENEYNNYLINNVQSKLQENADSTFSLVSFGDSYVRIRSAFVNDVTDDNGGVGIDSYGAGLNYYALLNFIDLLFEEAGVGNSYTEIIILADSLSGSDLGVLAEKAEEIRDKYPGVVFDGISYNTDGYKLKELDSICDNNYIANDSEEAFNIYDNILFSNRYESFFIDEYTNGDDFYIDPDSIKYSNGNVEIDGDLLTWNLSNNYYAGDTETLEYDLIINTDSYKMFYATDRHDVSSEIAGVEKNITSDETLVLNNDYEISFTANTPSGCTVRNMPSDIQEYVNVPITLPDAEPTCEGYMFKGWNLDTANRHNHALEFDNVKTMPENNIEYIATWSKLNVMKGLTGEVHEQVTLYSHISNLSTLDTDINFANDVITPFNSRVYEMRSTQFDDYPVYYYHGDVDDNNVLFGDICWKIIRTTETGGVKLIYNGEANEGSCDNDFATTSIGKSAYSLSIEELIKYDENDEAYAEADDILEILGIALEKISGEEGLESLESVDDLQDYINTKVFPNAYMYNEPVGSFKYRTLGLHYKYAGNMTSITSAPNPVLNSVYFGYDQIAPLNPYYASDVTYDDETGLYTLVDPVKEEDETTYRDLIKQYSCFSETATTCSVVYIFIENRGQINFLNEGDDVFVRQLEDGHKYDDPENSIIFGNSVTYEDGTYYLEDTYTTNYVEFLDDAEDLRDYRYTCLNSSDNCEEVFYIDSYYDDDINISDIEALFTENSELYEELAGMLGDEGITTIEDVNDLMTALSGYTDLELLNALICSLVAFFSSSSESFPRPIYTLNTIVLTDGALPEDRMLELYDTATNGVNSSRVKQTIDSWYEELPFYYPLALEDTYYCEDHNTSIKPNGNFFYYGAHQRLTSPSVECYPSDRYTVSNVNGNGLLTYPVGNITMDEITLTAWPEYADSNFWTMSPVGLEQRVVKQYNSKGLKIAPYVKLDVKPVISLDHSTAVFGGTGYADDPYVISSAYLEHN